MTRYFLSIQEAAELIVQAGALSKGGCVFLLDMGDPMLIAALAENMIQLAGLTIRNADIPHGDIEILVTGKRSGAKLYEELFYDAQVTTHAKIMRGPQCGNPVDIEQALKALSDAVTACQESSARKILFDLITMSGQCIGLSHRHADQPV